MKDYFDKCKAQKIIVPKDLDRHHIKTFDSRSCVLSNFFNIKLREQIIKENIVLINKNGLKTLFEKA